MRPTQSFLFDLVLTTQRDELYFLSTFSDIALKKLTNTNFALCCATSSHPPCLEVPLPAAAPRG